MVSYTLRRAFEAVATAHATSESVAQAAAADVVRDRLDPVRIDSTATYEFPSGPFDPYRVTVRATLSVTVEAPDERTAIESGTDEIDARLAAADLDAVEYVGETQLQVTG